MPQWARYFTSAVGCFDLAGAPLLGAAPARADDRSRVARATVTRFILSSSFLGAPALVGNAGAPTAGDDCCRQRYARIGDRTRGFARPSAFEAISSDPHQRRTISRASIRSPRTRPRT